MAAKPAVEVTWEDQQRINRFGRLNNRVHEAAAELQGKKKLAEDLEEASNELMISDEAEVRYVTGECFATLLRDEAEARLEAAAADAGRDCAALQAELAAAEREMEALKKLLYAKFGNAINLETD